MAKAKRIIIAFWGTQSGSGTTIGAYAVAAFYALRHKGVKTTVVSFDSDKLMDKLYNNKFSEKETEEVLFVDCRAYRTRECFNVMRDADIVVVNLRQDEIFMSNYVLGDMRMFPNAMILVGNCYSDFNQESAEIENKYRISFANMGVVPANEELAEAFDRKNISGFMNKEFDKCSSERNRRLLSEIARFTVKLERQMEQII